MNQVPDAVGIHGDANGDPLISGLGRGQPGQRPVQLMLDIPTCSTCRQINRPISVAVQGCPRTISTPPRALPTV